MNTSLHSEKPKQPMKRPALEDFLEQGGAEILPITNPWELVRFKTARGTHVVYNNAKGNKAYSDNHAQDAYRAYIDGKKWIAQEKVQRKSRKYLETAIRRLRWRQMLFLLPPVHRGSASDHRASAGHFFWREQRDGESALAHESCNMLAADMSVAEKVRLRDKMKENAND